MESLLETASRTAMLVIDGIALLVIVVGTIEAVIGGVRLMLSPKRSGSDRRAVWMHYARWLVAGLTFQLAADIIATSITTDWEAIARVAAIAIIRTFLNYFLEKDFTDLREHEERSP